MAVKKTGAAAAPAPDKDVENRKEIVRTIRGPVVERILKLIPALAAYPNPYQSVVSNPDLLYACLQLFVKQREAFQDLLVDKNGQPVMDDSTPLRCDRDVAQIVGMVVRSGCKAYAETRWAEPTAASAVKSPEVKSLMDKLRDLVSGKWSEAEQPKPGPTQATRFYQAINEHLNFDWQVPLIPYFAELPVKLLAELGAGCTQLRNPEAIAQLADIGRHNMEQARKILSDAMTREMLDTQPLAAKGVAFLGKDRYDYLHGAVYEKMGEKFWEMCVDCERLEAIEVQNAKDLEQMAAYLHLLGAETINQIVKSLQYVHIPIFLEVAYERFGETRFVEIFGSGGNKKLIGMFCQKAASYKLDQNDPDTDFRNRLPDVFNAYLRAPADFERGL